MPTQYIIRTSDRMQFKRCRQAWDFGSKMRQDYERNSGIKAMDFGTAIHRALEFYYDPLTWDKLPEIKEIASRQAFLDAIEEQRTKELRIGDLAFEIEQDFEERKDLGLAMLENYFLLAPDMDGELVPVRVEVEFEVPVLVPDDFHWKLPIGFYISDERDPPARQLYYGESPVVYQGRVDLLMYDPKTGKYWIVDHKTAAQLGSTEWLELDEQCTSYGWALEHMLGIDVSGIIYSQLRKKAPHPPAVLKNGNLSVNKQADTTTDLFLAECAKLGVNPAAYQEYIDFLNANPKEWVRRTVIRKTPTNYEIQGRRILMEAIEMLQDPMIYPAPSPGYMGCDGCQFFQPCLATQDGGDVQGFLDAMFTKRKEVEANAEG